MNKGYTDTEEKGTNGTEDIAGIGGHCCVEDATEQGGDRAELRCRLGAVSIGHDDTKCGSIERRSRLPSYGAILHSKLQFYRPNIRASSVHRNLFPQ